MKKSALALLSVVPFFASITVLAQGRSPAVDTKSVRVFKGSGLDGVARGNQPPPRRPQGLNPSDLTELAKILGKVEPGSTYITLSPSFPAVTNKGVLLFWDANLVETGLNYVYWGEKDFKHGVRGSVALWLWTPASRQYLIDCSLSGYEYPTKTTSEGGRSGPSFNVVGPNGDTQVFYFNNNVVSGPSSYSAFDLFKSDNAGAHLVFALTATTKGWYGFEITPHGVHGPGLAQWAFFSCEVKNL
jgi:hypothetical protein